MAPPDLIPDPIPEAIPDMAPELAPDRGALQLAWRDSDPAGGAPGVPVLVLLHALGTDAGLWDPVMAHLPPGVRVIRPDLRGHGASPAPPGPYAMGAMIRDVERLLEGLGLRDTVVAGVSLGGLIAQGLAVKRLDLVRGLVLSNTATKIATAEIWAERARIAQEAGLAPLIAPCLARWFPPALRRADLAALWQTRLASCSPAGYAGACAALGGADFLTPTSGLRLPALVLASDRDGATPADLVRELAQLIPGADFALIRQSGHLPMQDQPQAWAAAVSGFLQRIAHV